ncbi:Gastricsin [Symbiodinium microadriaticum]|uniref:Gastricsin n=1 Tax=Symbiodinium microadriaticum TaxID=2951 RepID=A0A1Q9CTF9_SYMMI|nr:Gastricsin [Symbiodinium microadriaticum]
MLRFGFLLAAAVQTASCDDAADASSMLQRPPIEAAMSARPHVIGLRRESVPVYRRGKIASFKTSYSGVLSVGQPAQEFRVVFDTGSGNIILPAAECHSEACLMPHRKRYSQSSSVTSHPINSDGSRVLAGELGEQVTIGFGTGEVTGEFARDRVCFGSSQNTSTNATEPLETAVDYRPVCVEMSVIVAVEMSTQPFKTFQFDGILGLGLSGLTMNRNFSAFDMIVKSGMAAQPIFSVFLSDGEFGEQSEVAMGGVDPRRLVEPISWSDVAMQDLGYWQVRIRSVRIGGEELDVCLDGTCRGVVDTGTSHLGVPAPWDKEVEKRLKREAGDLLDCRNAEAPEIEIELHEGKVITLYPFNYMRRLPLREGVSVGSSGGVQLKQAAAPATESVVLLQGDGMAAAPSPSVPAQGNNSELPVERHCSPRLMAVKLPEPLGPKLFILGEPVLHRYYTVYDWEQTKVGFALANSRQNSLDPAALRGQKGELPKEVDMLLMQQQMKVTRSKVVDGDLEEETLFLQTVGLSGTGARDSPADIGAISTETSMSLAVRRRTANCPCTVSQCRVHTKVHPERPMDAQRSIPGENSVPLLRRFLPVADGERAHQTCFALLVGTLLRTSLWLLTVMLA